MEYESTSTKHHSQNSTLNLDTIANSTEYDTEVLYDVFTSNPLECIDLDEDEETFITFENSTDGFRICDLCPNIPPFDQLTHISINQEDNIPLSIKHHIDFSDCFMECLDDKRCIAYSYSKTHRVCLTFSKMRANADHLQLSDELEYWVTVIIKQPTGVIREWFYTRNTRFYDNGEKLTADTFLKCLQLCRLSKNCSALTYEFYEKSCELFHTISDDASMSTYSSYGYISAVNFQLIYGKDSNIWRFIEEKDYLESENITNSKNNNITVENRRVCRTSSNTSINTESLNNPDCFTEGNFSNSLKST